MPQAILIDSNILIDFSRGVKGTAEYLANTSAITTPAMSTIQMELIVGSNSRRLGYQ